MNQHDLIVALKTMAIELGRTPSALEFRMSISGGQKLVELHFGTHAVLVQAAGLDPYRYKKRVYKAPNAVFEKNLEKHLEEHRENLEEPLIREPYPTLAVISDIHWPFHHQPVVDSFLEYVGDEKPSYVILNGDAHDAYSHAKFPRSHNIFTPREEQTSARNSNEIFWAEVKKRNPKAQCYQMMGNHDIRPLKRMLESYPEAEDWVVAGMNKLFTFEGVTTIFNPREELRLNGNILVFHGYLGKLGDHRDFTLHNCIVGHTHRPGVVIRQIRGCPLWEMNSGYAGNPEAKGLTYTPQKITNWVWSFSVVDKRGPRVIIF